MNCLARILYKDGYRVTGSDQNPSSVVFQLGSMGISVSIGHKPEHIPGDTELVVYTAAVQSDNPELVAARTMGIRTMDRAELLGLIMRHYDYPICVAGTHGKTTTTSMLAEVFLAADADPTVLVGGYLDSIGGTLRDGGEQYFVAESCEYFDSFLKFFPYIGIILNLEADHLDYFEDEAAVRRSFARFAGLIPPEGTLIINAAIPNLSEITEGLSCRIITYDMNRGRWQARDIHYDREGCASFTALFDGLPAGRITLSVPGAHNIQNALATAATADVLGLPFEAVSQGLFRFHGAKRRFQKKGVINGVTIVDDYAHHPTEISTTLRSAKNMDYDKVWCVFQPHTHSRTKNLLHEFAACFDEADYVVLLDIYSPAGREEPSTHIHSLDLLALIEERGKKALYFPSFDEAEKFLQEKCLHNSLLITMGAGDVVRLGENMLKH